MKCASPRTRHRGFAAIVAIFMVVALAALGATITAVSTTTSRTQALDFLSIQSYQAVNAGLDYGVYQAMANSVCNAATTLEPTQWDSRFRVKVECSVLETDDRCLVFTPETPTCATNVYQLVATVCNRRAHVGADATSDPCPGEGGEGYIERQGCASRSRAPGADRRIGRCFANVKQFLDRRVTAALPLHPIRSGSPEPRIRTWRDCAHSNPELR